MISLQAVKKLRTLKKISKYLNVKYSVSCINGTAGLDLAFKGIKLKTDDVIVMPVINFIASYSMAENLGAKIFLTDVDPLYRPNDTK